MDYSLESMVAPIPRRVFLDEYWERKPLLAAREDPEFFRSLLSVDEIDEVINARDIRYPDLYLVNAEREVSREQYSFRGNAIDTAAVFKLFGEGCTVVLSPLHTRVASLAAFCRSMEREFSVPFQTNVYLTPGNAKGFKPHYDTHDVFILQVSNSKHWVVRESPVRLPLQCHEYDPSRDEPGGITLEVDLQPGDTLYIPRGFVHEAQSNDKVSLHITVGVLSYSWADVLFAALSDVCLKDHWFRSAVPIGFAQEGFDRRQARETFRALLGRFAAEADLDATFDYLIDEFVSTRRAILRGQMTQVSKLGEICADSLLEPRRDLVCSLRENEESIALSCYGTEISLPLHAAPAVKFALRAPRFRARDLPGGIDDEGKLVLIRRLVREGVLSNVNGI